MPKRKRNTAKIWTDHPPPKSMHFPFSELPAEIRNSIYQHFLSVDRHNLYFSLDGFPKLDVNTSLLCINKQVYAEAMSILYSGSMSATIGKFASIPFRQDQAARGGHSLRNGTHVSMTSFTGRIYPHVLARFRKLVLSIDLLYQRRRDCRRQRLALRFLMDTMIESPQLKVQIEALLLALMPTLRSSFMGPRVRELEINTDRMRVLLSLQSWRDPERIAEFKREQKRLLMPFTQFFGLQSVEIVGVIDQNYVNLLKRIMEGDGPGSQEARQALVMMILAGNHD